MIIANILFSIFLAGVDALLIKKDVPLGCTYKVIKLVVLTIIYSLVAVISNYGWAFVPLHLMIYSFVFDTFLNIFRGRPPFKLSETTSWYPERKAAQMGVIGIIFYNFFRLFILFWIGINLCGWFIN